MVTGVTTVTAGGGGEDAVKKNRGNSHKGVEGRVVCGQ